MAKRGRKPKLLQGKERQKKGIQKRGRPRSSTGKADVSKLTKEVLNLNSACTKVFQTLTPQPYAYVGMDQRSTKSIGNFETFVFGFSLTVPIPIEKSDDISSEETQKKFRDKYEDISAFLSSLMGEVESRVDSAQNLVPSSTVLTDSKSSVSSTDGTCPTTTT